MKAILVRALVAVLFPALFSVQSEAQSTKCRPADAASRRLIAQLEDWMTTTDPERQADRDTAYKIPLVSVTSIAVVTDERICGKCRSRRALMRAASPFSGT